MQFRLLDRVDRYIFSVFEAIKTKPDWQNKIFVYEEKWRDELIRAGHDNKYNVKYNYYDICDTKGKYQVPIVVDDELMNLIFNRLKCEVSVFPRHIQAAWIRNVYYSDDLISSKIKSKLIKLEVSLKSELHHGSKSTYDLIHPSMYCLMSEVGCVWLPTPFSFKNTLIKFSSYINGLHPDNKSGYKVIADILCKIMPLFEFTLSYGYDIDHEDKENYQVCWRCRGTGIWREYGELGECFCQSLCWQCEEPLPCPDGCKPYSLKSKIKLPQFTDFKITPRRLNNGKVIVKMATINLTPDVPTYEGGSWHIEGIPEECITASAIYYYDQHNITESHLAFRERIPDDGIPYKQNEFIHVFEKFGIPDEYNPNQYLGKISTPKDRVLVFPNTYQHQVQSFSLVDKKQPGYRKILAFFFVNSDSKSISTKDTGVFRHDWVRPLLEAHFPAVLSSLILDYFSEYTYETAKNNMVELMKARSIHVAKDNEYYEQEYSLCEH